MCMLCLVSRWSRRIVTMLPWLIFPLIILWALSQLLPSEFQFDMTSPKLACVGLLVISLGWYELAMPRLTIWLAKRSALLKERKRLEFRQAVKWRKEATRRCRNCLSPYREQTPVGGKFICTFCGHISRRPVLDVPPSTVNVAGVLESVRSKCNASMSTQSPPGGGHTVDTRENRSIDTRGGRWSSRGWPLRTKFSVFGVSLSWRASKEGPRGPVSSSGAYYGFPLCSQWDFEHSNGNLTRWVGKESHGGDSSMFFLMFRMFFFILVCFRWLGRKAWNGGSIGDESLVDGRRGGHHEEEDNGSKKGSRGEKSRRKAEEKRQARITREQIESDERRQREEVARLVEERRRCRDKKLETELFSEREIAAERDRELCREREAERRFREKLKESETTMDRHGTRDALEDGEGSSRKERKRDWKAKNAHEGKPNEGAKRLDAVKTLLTGREIVKMPAKSGKADLCTRGTDTKIAGSLKTDRWSRILHFPAITNSKMQDIIASPMSDNCSIAAASPVKGSQSMRDIGVKNVETICTSLWTPSVQHLGTGCSVWENACWRNVSDNVALRTPFEACGSSPAISSNFDMQLTACSDYLDKANWFGGDHSRGNSQRGPKNFADQDHDGDLIIHSRVAPGETVISQRLSGNTYVSPIGPQQDMYARPSTLSRNVGTISGKYTSPLMLEPWADGTVSKRHSECDTEVLGADAANDNGNWKMWEAPQLDQIRLPCIKDSSNLLAYMLPVGLVSEVATPSSIGISEQLEIQLPKCYVSSQPGHNCLNCPVSLPSISTSLWSDQPPSLFRSTNVQLSSGVVGCIAQEGMEESVTKMDDYFYEHSSFLRELQTYDTSPVPGEHLAPVPDAELGIDRYIISEQRAVRLQPGSAMHSKRVDVQDRSRWSVGIASAAWPNAATTNTKRTNCHGGIYSTPCAQSVWSFNAP